jgi:hypothetical protein
VVGNRAPEDKDTPPQTVFYAHVHATQELLPPASLSKPPTHGFSGPRLSHTQAFSVLFLFCFSPLYCSFEKKADHLSATRFWSARLQIYLFFASKMYSFAI